MTSGYLRVLHRYQALPLQVPMTSEPRPRGGAKVWHHASQAKNGIPVPVCGRVAAVVVSGVAAVVVSGVAHKPSSLECVWARAHQPGPEGHKAHTIAPPAQHPGNGPFAFPWESRAEMTVVQNPTDPGGGTLGQPTLHVQTPGLRSQPFSSLVGEASKARSILFSWAPTGWSTLLV